MDSKDVKSPFQWWGKHETMFPIVAFLVHQILSSARSQFEIEIIFFFSGHTYKPKEMFIIRKLRNFDFCEQKLAK